LLAVFAEMPGASQSQPGRWDVALAGDISVAARIADSWLVITSPLPEAYPAPSLITCNGRLPGWVKFAVEVDGCQQVRAELPLDEELCGAAAVHEILKGIQFAHAILSGEQSGPVQPELLPTPTQTALLSLSEEAGWPAIARGDTAIAVELECRGAFHQAVLAPFANGLRAFTEFAACENPESQVMEATSHFLLDASRVIRMVRPVLDQNAGKETPGFEFLLSSAPSIGLLAHALSGLSIACRLCAKEMRALQNTDVANQYLALRGECKTVPGHSAT
jgi:hypothetical protein